MDSQEKEKNGIEEVEKITADLEAKSKEQQVVALTATEKHKYEDTDQEQEHKDEESEERVLFVGRTNATTNHHRLEKSREKQGEEDMAVLDCGESLNGQFRTSDRSRAVMTAHGYVTPATLEAELQCIVCQYTMFKPVSAICGHSFCRVCLMDSILTHSMERTRCPICRVDILQPYSSKLSLASIFSVNVTLWNLIQLLIPPIAARISIHQKEEDEKFTRKLDELNAQWKVFHLHEHAATYHGDHDDRETRPWARWEEGHGVFVEYPVLKVEDTRDGNLHISRSVVLDTSDGNEDGYMNMRVGIAIVEFPSIFELYNEHQECSVNVIKMEEDEEVADGLPFFMNEDGDDDALVCGSYYNEICLRVCDEAGNCVMERTRGAQGGIVTFPRLRLDVPGDDLYVLKLSITTRLREPHEMADTPTADYVGLINNEARDGSRRHRRRYDHSDSEGANDEVDSESDDSFIVNDFNDDVGNGQPVGRFSDDDDEGEWHIHAEANALDVERGQCQSSKQQCGRGSERDVQIVTEEKDEVSSEDDRHECINVENGVDEQESEDEDDVRPGHRNVRVINDAMLSSENASESPDVDFGRNENKENDPLETIVRPRQRNPNQISEDEDECGHVGNEEKRKSGVDDHRLDEQQWNDGKEGIEEDDGSEAVPSSLDRKVKREEWLKGIESDKVNTHRPRRLLDREDDKRSRKRIRQVGIIINGQSDEEKAMEPSI